MSSRIKRWVATLAVIVYTAESLSSSFPPSSRQSFLSIPMPVSTSTSTTIAISTARQKGIRTTPSRKCMVLYSSEIDSSGFDNKNEFEDDFEHDDNDDNDVDLDNDDDNDSTNDDDDTTTTTPTRTLVASPLSQLPAEEDGPPEVMYYYRGNSRNEHWLEEATEDMLDTKRLPFGSLSEDDVESIAGLMAAWVRRRSVDAALTVEQLLKRVVDDMRAQNPDVFVTTKMYTIAIDAWSKSGSDAGAQRAQQIHDSMVTMYEQTGDPQIMPSSISYNTLMNAYPTSPEMAEKVLKQMMDWNTNTTENDNDKWHDDTTMKPDATTFSTMMYAYARSKDKNATHRAEELFEMMDTLGVKRSVLTFSALQNVYARSGKSDAPEKTMEVVQRMLHLYSNGDVFAKPNCCNYNAVLNAYSRTPSKESATQADQMLRTMELSVVNGGFDIEPDRLSYALTILACARCPDETYGAFMAEDNLMKMEQRAQMEAKKRAEVSSAAPPAVTMDIECFNVVLTAISKCRQQDAVGRTMEIVTRMDKYAQAGQEHIRPNIRSWNAVLNSLSRATSRDANSTTKAEQILTHIFDLYKNSGLLTVKPDAFSYAAVLSAYQRSDDPSAAKRADDLITKMEELHDAGDLATSPDVYHYTIVCATWAKSRQKEAPTRVVQILAHMKDRHGAGYPDVKPNVRTYNAVLDCLSRSKEEEKAEQLLYHMLALSKGGDRDSRPDSFSFNSVINAFTRSRQKDAGRRAESVLDRFLEHSEEFPKVRPDARSFIHIVAYYGRMGKHMMDAPYRAEYVLNRMIALFKSGHEEVAPTVFAFTTVMDSYSHHKHPDAGECAERLMRQMEKLKANYNANKLEVNTGVLHCVLLAWASCGDENAGRRAETHLEEMKRQYQAGRIELQPNSKTYGLVLNAWTKSGNFDKAQRALDVLERMKEEHQKGELNVGPSEHAYSLVINACAFTNSGLDAEAKAFKIAIKVMKELIGSADLEPSSLTYGWFFQACGRLRVPDHLKDPSIEVAFLRCCERGLMNDFVLNRLKGAATETLFKKLMAPVANKVPKYDQTKEKLKQRLLLQHLPGDWKGNRLSYDNNARTAGER